ncbi:MAG: MBL fold metallo-hydrolase [Pseudonocardiales bacterium]|nr:MBL fold metallo-hydrolase [Pseudonocardiales bacterium]
MAVNPIVRSLGPGVAAYLQLPGGWFLNNAGWLSGTEATLLIDTCATEARTRDLLAALHTHTPAEQRPVTVALTHAHGDHAHGAGLISRLGGTVLCRPTAATTIAAGPHTYPELFSYTDWGDITPLSDVQTITARTTLDLGPRRSAEIVPVPNTAHTDGDLVVWIPREGVLFPGDLVFTDVTPLAAHGSITGWLAALDWLADFEATHIVPGHGAMGAGPTRGLIAPLVDYFHWLLDVVHHGDPDFTALHHHACTRWHSWLDSERHAANLRIAHAEIHGYRCDGSTAMAAMTTFTGGTIPLNL